MRLTTKVLSPALCLIVLGCTDLDSGIQPDWTSYPRDRVTQGEIRIGLGNEYARETSVPGYSSVTAGEGVFSIDIPFENRGDEAVRIRRIVPEGTGDSQAALLALVPQYGPEACGGDYRLYSTTYYFGHEATLDWLRINSAMLEVLFRCPVYRPGEADGQEMQVRALASRFADSEYFDVQFNEFPVSADRLYAAVLRAIEDENLPDVEQGQRGSARYILAERENKRPRPYIDNVKIVALVSGDGENASLGYMVLYFISGRHRFALSQGRDEVIGWAPIERDLAYDEARRFLREVEEQLTSPG